jgi:cytochrome c-type biogenesis protein CcmH
MTSYLSRPANRPNYWAFFVLLVFFAFTFFPLQHAWAQSSEPSDDQVNYVAHQLYCPVCENTPLDVCPTQACAQWRATIKEKLAAGWSEQQIKDYFVQQYGERVLAQPSIDGLNIILWIMAPLGVLVAASVYIYYLRQMQRPLSATAPVASPPADDYAKQLEEELAKRR